MSNLWIAKADALLTDLVNKYTENTKIPPEWVIGLIFVEDAELNPKASRFEPHVYESILWVAKGNRSTAFPGFNAGRIKTFIIDPKNANQLKPLATSYGLAQIMGYGYYSHFGLKPEQFTNLTVEDSVKWAVEFMKLNYPALKFPYYEKSGRVYTPYEQLLRKHNTGSIVGTTYDLHYCQNAMQIAKEYADFIEAKGVKK